MKNTRFTIKACDTMIEKWEEVQVLVGKCEKTENKICITGKCKGCFVSFELPNVENYYP